MAVIPKHRQLIVSSPLFLFLILGESLPLREVKTLRETLREKNLLNNFLEERAYRLFKNDSKTAILPLRNFLDVSLLGGWLSTPAPCALS